MRAAFCLFLLALVCSSGHLTQKEREKELSDLETPDNLAKVHMLVQDNLDPALNVWREMARRHNGQKLTMRAFFKTASHMRNELTASFWGIKDNKLFRPSMDGPARYDPITMMHEHRPNKDAAEWSLLSMWLALDEAMKAGVQFPNVLFVYNAGDQPMCNKYYTCSSYEHVPPISVIGYNESLLPPHSGPVPDFVKGTGAGDLVTPHFRFTGHSKGPSLHPHHPDIVSLRSNGDPEWSKNRIITKNPVPWESKIPKLLFRGVSWCSYIKRYGCPRKTLSNLSTYYPDDLDVAARGAHVKGANFMPMAAWSKYKFLAALDGIGASSRTIALYHLGSVVLKQRRTAYVEWFYQSLKPGIHHEEIYHSDTDTIDVVKKLKADDARAKKLAETGTDFASKYLVKEVMMVYTKVLLQKYKELFEDMEDYMQAIGDPGNSSAFQTHARSWFRDWRTLPPSPHFAPNLPSTGIFRRRRPSVAFNASYNTGFAIKTADPLNLMSQQRFKSD